MRIRFHDINAREFIPSRRRQCDQRQHETEDAAQPVAMFAKGHSAKEHDDGLRIHSPAGQHIATFHAPHVARVQGDGALHIFAKPRVTKDAPLPERLADLNRRNAEFYRRKQ